MGGTIPWNQRKTVQEIPGEVFKGRHADRGITLEGETGKQVLRMCPVSALHCEGAWGPRAESGHRNGLEDGTLLSSCLRRCWQMLAWQMMPGAAGFPVQKETPHTAGVWQMGCPEPGREKPFLLHCLCSPLTKHNVCKLAKKRHFKNPSIFLQDR